MTVTTAMDRHPTACILCECKCSIEVRLGADGRSFERIHGDKALPASQGYTGGGGGQGDHPCGAHSPATRAALGSQFRSNSLAQEKAGEFWVNGRIAGSMIRRHVSLPNGLGVSERPDDGVVGVAPNELTASDHRDPVAGTPYHKHVPARFEPLPVP